MKHFCLILLFFITDYTLIFGQLTRQDSAYTYKKPEYDGTGKVYMGREIAKIMSFEAADWLERNNREKEENTYLAISKLPINKLSIVADIGAGTGYYTFRIAPKIPQGKIFAVEIQSDAIKYLQSKARKLPNNNVIVVKGSEQSPKLPANMIDLAIMVDVYHELSYPHEVLQSLRRSLKANGKLLLLEYRAEDPKVEIKPLHKTSIIQINKELKANGFHLVQDGEFLPIQHFLLYQKN